MEVSVEHSESGRSCVVCVKDTDTVLDLKERALKDMFAGREGAGAVLARTGGCGGAGEGARLDLEDTQRIADTCLEGGGHVQLVPRWPAVKEPAEYGLNGEEAHSLCLSPCGTLCVAGTYNGSLFVFDTPSAEQAAHVRVGNLVITSAAFSRCGRWLACASEKPVAIVYCTAKWERAHILEGHTLSVLVVAWTHCGRVISGSADRALRVWDVAGEDVATTALQGHTGNVCAAAVSHTAIFSGSNDGSIRVWNLAELSHRDTLKARMGTVYHLALSSSGSHLASCSADKSVIVWCTATLQCLWRANVGTAPYEVAVSQEGDVVAVSSYDSTHLCALSTGKHVGERPGVPNLHNPIALSPCGRWIFTTGDHSVRVLA